MEHLLPRRRNKPSRTSLLTGESRGVTKRAGDRVYAGSYLLKGFLVVKVQKVGSGTAITQITQLVEQAQLQKAPVQELVDKVAQHFVPAVMGFAGVVVCVWMVLVFAGCPLFGIEGGICVFDREREIPVAGARGKGVSSPQTQRTRRCCGTRRTSFSR